MRVTSLTFHKVSFERRHDLSYLIDLCASLDRDFEQWRPQADELTPYAVEFRYPDALPCHSAVTLPRRKFGYAVEFRYPDALLLMSPRATKVSVDAANRIYVFVARLVQDVADSS